MSAHSKIGASGYYRWKACPGSVRLSEGIVQAPSSYALEGTQAHEILEQILRDHFFGLGKPDIPPTFPPEGMEAIKKAADVIKKEAVRHGCKPNAGQVLIEYKFDLSSVYPGLFGTADVVLYGETEKKLVVIDYKHGQGVAVEAEDNLQLQYYGLGALLNSGFPCKTVELVIIQPRCEHADGIVRRWSFPSSDLIEFSGQLAEDAKATESKDAPLKTGVHCRFCPAAASRCPEIHKRALEAAQTQFNKVDEYKEDKLKKALDILESVKAWTKNVEDFALAQAKLGNVPEGYKLVQKRATRKWIGDENEVIKKLENLAPRKDFINKKVKTPAQVEKLLPKDMREEISNMVTKGEPNYKVVSNDKPGEPCYLGPQTEFSKIEG